jgi:hypothetical protein
MKPAKKTAAKSRGKLRDLKSTKNPRGGIGSASTGAGGGKVTRVSAGWIE